uniref:Uncharacterized protein n=1 Tax=Picocystis salinarum TaxID=88271 RepID=A0A7S3UF57_9CHLO
MEARHVLLQATMARMASMQVRLKPMQVRPVRVWAASDAPARGSRAEAAEEREERLLEKYEYLLSLGNVDEFHLTDLKRRKSISARSMGALKRCVEWLTDLGMTEQEAVRVIFRFPPIVGLNYERKIEATYEWFQTKEVAKEKFLALVIRYPQFLGLSLEDNIIPALGWYMQTFDFTEEEAIKVLLKHPVILGYSIEKKVIPFLEYLMEEASLTKEEVAVVVKVFPQIIGLNKKSVSKKLDFIRNDIGIEIDDLVKFPHLCGYSLEKRIRPRYMYLKHLGKEFALPPSKVLPATDADFASRLGKSHEDYMEFCKSLR